jgi:hypothetical protein
MLFKKLVVPGKVKQFSGKRRKYISDIGRRGGGAVVTICYHPFLPPIQHFIENQVFVSTSLNVAFH